ncbi:MAG: hypothetical protein FWE23_07645 [Chitinivibrionia bacterium]|nr:hypothetical protein [Chitinivibrionia bacterium]
MKQLIMGRTAFAVFLSELKKIAEKRQKGCGIMGVFAKTVLMLMVFYVSVWAQNVDWDSQEAKEWQERVSITNYTRVVLKMPNRNIILERGRKLPRLPIDYVVAGRAVEVFRVNKSLARINIGGVHIFMVYTKRNGEILSFFCLDNTIEAGFGYWDVL